MAHLRWYPKNSAILIVQRKIEKNNKIDFKHFYTRLIVEITMAEMTIRVVAIVPPHIC